MRIAAHQPNFIPWLPFFHKMDNCDVFVVLQHLQFTKDKYMQRAKIHDEWVTMPVKKHALKTNLSDIEYADPALGYRKVVQKVWEQWARAGDAKMLLDSIQANMLLGINTGNAGLVSMNTAILVDLARLFGITTMIVGDLPSVLTKTERLIELCKRCGADEYLTGCGAVHPETGYLDVEAMKRAGIRVFVQHAQSVREHFFETLSVPGATIGTIIDKLRSARGAVEELV